MQSRTPIGLEVELARQLDSTCRAVEATDHAKLAGGNTLVWSAE